MNTPETNINTITVAPVARLATVCSINQIHQCLSLAVRDERRVEATISEIRDRDGTMWLGMTQSMADTRSAKSLSGRVDRSARQALDDAAGGLFCKDHLGSTIVADIRLGLAHDGKVKATVIDVLQICPSPHQRAARNVRQALQNDGLLALQRHLPTPLDVRAVAVICPPASAGMADVAQIFGRLFGPWQIEIRWIPTTFEGPTAEASIKAALDVATYLAGRNEVSAVLIVRGGASPGALAYLDSELLARAVATMRVPVVVGIGHADNRTLLDDVAHHSAATPTDAAQWIVRLRGAIERAKPVPVEPEKPLTAPPAAESVSACVDGRSGPALPLTALPAHSFPVVVGSDRLDASAVVRSVAPIIALQLEPDTITTWRPPVVTAAGTGKIIDAVAQARLVGPMVIEFTDGAVVVQPIPQN